MRMAINQKLCPPVEVPKQRRNVLFIFLTLNSRGLCWKCISTINGNSEIFDFNGWLSIVCIKDKNCSMSNKVFLEKHSWFFSVKNSVVPFDCHGDHFIIQVEI